MSYQIFISYRRDGGEPLAYLLHEQLTNLGYKVFYDIKTMSNGKFNQEIYDRIDECKDFLLLLTPNALDRCSEEGDWVRNEISYAIKQGKNIIPVMTKGFTWSNNMPDDIKDVQYYNGVLATFEFFSGVIETIERYLTTSTHVSEVKRGQDVKKVLFWGDFSYAAHKRIINELKLGDKYDIEVVDYPINLLTRDISDVDAIILLVTDCTKFSANLVAVQRINDFFVEYVTNGGKLICAHDVIYRRTKNEALQVAFGCKITNFQQCEKVTYIKTQICKDNNLFASLPNEFKLSDAEICWGNLASDVDVLFENEEGLPLVFQRRYGNGYCIFFNSGDYKDNLPHSILKPEKEFIELLREIITMDCEVI